MEPTNSAASINFDPLNQLRSGLLGTSISLWWAWIAVPAAMIGIMGLLISPHTKNIAIALIVITIPVAIVLALIASHRRTKHNQAVLQVFAAANGMTYQPKGAEVESAGTLFEPGYDKTTRNILSGIIHDLPFSSYEYFYTTGSGKSRTTHDAMVLEVTLPRVLPQFVIDSQLESVVPLVFDKSQKIELEGDFHKYFDLYAPDTYGVSALTLLAPDTMEVLMEHAALCDIEVVQNKLFFYWPVPAATRQQYEQLFVTTKAVLAKLGSKLTKDDIYSTQSQAQVHAQPNGSGVRLKRSKVGIFVVAFIMFYIAMQFVGNTPLAGVGSALIALFWVGFIGWIFISAAKQNKLKQEYLRRYKRD